MPYGTVIPYPCPRCTARLWSDGQFAWCGQFPCLYGNTRLVRLAEVQAAAGEPTEEERHD